MTNIWSGGEGIGAVLTNMTELAYRKGKLRNHYPVFVFGDTYIDADAAYQDNKTGLPSYDDELMSIIILAKLRQHPAIPKAIKSHGGIDFLKSCSHYTNATTERFKSWEGRGTNSRFIRNLVKAFEIFENTGFDQKG